jgi:hypothetical protein
VGWGIYNRRYGQYVTQHTEPKTYVESVNLALSFARRGLRSGILDTDIFGPSIPTLLNLSGEPRLSQSIPHEPSQLWVVD